MLDALDTQSILQQRQLLLANLSDCRYYVAETAQQANQIWAVRGSLVRAVEAVTEQDPIDTVVPINRIADFITFTKQLSEENGVRMLAFGHAGDGNIHLCILRDGRSDSVWLTQLTQIHEALYQKCHELGGLPSAEHGIGTAKVNYFKQAIPEKNRHLMQLIKQQYDPKNILNNQVYITQN